MSKETTLNSFKNGSKPTEKDFSDLLDDLQALAPGDKGDLGPKGDQGDQGDTGKKGPKGDKGPQGVGSETAYLSVNNLVIGGRQPIAEPYGGATIESSVETLAETGRKIRRVKTEGGTSWTKALCRFKPLSSGPINNVSVQLDIKNIGENPVVLRISVDSYNKNISVTTGEYKRVNLSVPSERLSHFQLEINSSNSQDIEVLVGDVMVTSGNIPVSYLPSLKEVTNRNMGRDEASNLTQTLIGNSELTLPSNNMFPCHNRTMSIDVTVEDHYYKDYSTLDESGVLIPIEPGETYTLSYTLDVKSTTVPFLVSSVGLANFRGVLVKDIDFYNIPSELGVQHVEHTFKVPEELTSESATFNFGIRLLRGREKHTTKGVYSDIMLVKGSKAQPWTPHPQDIQDRIASIKARLDKLEKGGS